MSDTGTQAPPRQSEFPGTQAARTPDELRAEQAAAFAAANPQLSQQQPPPPGITQQQADAIAARAREEALASVSPQLAAVQQMQSDLAALRTEREAEIAAAKAEVEEANRLAEEERQSKMTLTQRLEHHTRETDERFRRMEEERATEQAIFAREREFSAQNEYRTQALTENADQIMPQFRDLVAVGDKETVDRSIADLKARTQSVVNDVQAARQQEWMGQRGVSPTGVPASGPLENLPDQTQEFTADQIAAMSPAEYARNRPRLMQAASRYMNGRR